MKTRRDAIPLKVLGGLCDEGWRLKDCCLEDMKREFEGSISAMLRKTSSIDSIFHSLHIHTYHGILSGGGRKLSA